MQFYQLHRDKMNSTLTYDQNLNILNYISEVDCLSL